MAKTKEKRHKRKSLHQRRLRRHQVIEQEAKAFSEKKKKLTPEKELTPRRMYAGLALSGLLSGGVHHTPPEEVAKQAWKWADILDKEEP